jgi:plasmid stabilization system protein ParE
VDVIWTEPALNDVGDIFDFLNGENPVAAVKVIRTLRLTGDRLMTFPKRGRRVGRTSMREVTTKYPYIIRYRVEGDAVFILRVRHTSRRPMPP